MWIVIWEKHYLKLAGRIPKLIEGEDLQIKDCPDSTILILARLTDIRSSIVMLQSPLDHHSSNLNRGLNAFHCSAIVDVLEGM